MCESRLYRWNSKIFQILNLGTLPSTRREAKRRLKEAEHIFNATKSQVKILLFTVSMHALIQSLYVGQDNQDNKPLK